ncbi:MAG: bifunctional phosphopantothenoylcysteine decarboxylase/phosphopantothenate--cysteine ligase CoaBC, partial [Rhodospirillales bacterium]|nr:bifunctional phosphopantothenoylcysteine decarboxylase/phosphopantothenate--cysteine ligase CoaBC [Rhodospirillales bacterium]
PVLVAPAMNVRMWEHPATQANIQILKARGVGFIGPNAGDMACGEYGMGRMAEPAEIVDALEAFFGPLVKRLSGRRAIVTSGPTHEAIDPVRYIANRSSGKQGHAIAAAFARAGAATTLVTGPTMQIDPPGVSVVHIESARDMLEACRNALPAHVAVCAAAVSDWRPDAPSDNKIKKNGGGVPALTLMENPDILASLAKTDNARPALVIGFAAETENVAANATAKRLKKGCDWILANDVSTGSGTFGGDENQIHFVTETNSEDWPRMSKEDVAGRLVDQVARHFAEQDPA